MLGLFVLVRKVRDVWQWLNCMHVDTSEGGAVNVKVWFPECPLFGGKNTLQNALGPRIVSAVRSLEVVATQCITSMVFSIRD